MKASKEELPPCCPEPVHSDIYPLDEFYAARGAAAPDFARLQPDKLPQPYRSLLAHDTDMTSTLEKFYGETLHIEVLASHTRESEYYREVVLILDGTKKRVEFGAIKINLGLFPIEAQQEILREQQPLARIIIAFNIPFTSRPAAFLRLPSDNFIGSALRLREPHLLYGRRNALLDSRERPLAEIVEILPP